MAGRGEPGERFFVVLYSIALEFYLSIPLKSERFQDPEHLVCHARHDAIAIEVLDA